MASLGSLIISLEANIAKFESSMNKAVYTAQKSSDAIKGTFVALGTALASALSIKAIENMIVDMAGMEGSLLKMAGRLNTTVETLSSFGVMARKTGMDTDSFYLALTRLEKGMSVAGMKAEEATNQVDENGEAIQKANTAYNALGLNIDVLLKMPLDQQLMAIAEAFKNNIDPADRVNIAMQLFGKSGAGMVNILRGGAADIQKWITEQQNLGIVTTENANKAAEFNAAVANLSAGWSAFVRNIVNAVIPALSEVINSMNIGIAAARQMKENRAFAEQYFPGFRIANRAGEEIGGIGPWGEVAGEPGAVSPMPYTPPAGLMKPPVRPGGISKAGGGGGGGKGGGGDAGLDRMQSIIDTLQKDLSRLTEGSLAEIREWANKTRSEIDKVGKKGADTETAMRLAAQVEGAKKKKVTEDYELFVAKESGDAYKQIEADAREWLTKYKGFADAEKNIQTIKNRKVWEEDVKQQTDRLGLQKSFLESIASEMPLLSQQLAIRKQLLPIETQLRHLELDRQMAAIKLSNAQKDELRALLAVEIQAKKYTLERAKWAKQGTVGGLKIASAEMKRDAETWASEQTAALVTRLPNELSSLIASSLVGFLQGKAPDLQQLGISMAESMLKTLLDGILQQIIPSLIEGLAEGLGSILEGIGGGGGGGIFGSIFEGVASVFSFFHGGGVITAHGGWPLRSDERLIRAQTGERVLSREQNKAYEAGMSGAPITMVNNFRYQMTQAEWDRAIKLQIIPGIKKANANRGGGLS